MIGDGEYFGYTVVGGCYGFGYSYDYLYLSLTLFLSIHVINTLKQGIHDSRPQFDDP